MPRAGQVADQPFLTGITGRDAGQRVLGHAELRVLLAQAIAQVAQRPDVQAAGIGDQQRRRVAELLGELGDDLALLLLLHPSPPPFVRTRHGGRSERHGRPEGSGSDARFGRLGRA